jgi:hypothetical protein
MLLKIQNLIMLATFFALEARAEGLSFKYEFGFRECTIDSGNESNLKCTEKTSLQKSLQLELMEDGGECTQFGPSEFASIAAPAKTLANRIQHEATIQSLRLGSGAIACAYSFTREYNETFVPLVLVETNSNTSEVSMLLSLARSSSNEEGEILTQVESTSVNFKDLQSLKENPSIFLRAREISRKTNAIVYPFFRVLSEQ